MTEIKKQKIILAITKAHWGGAQKYVFDLANYLATDDKYKVVVLLGGQGLLKTKLDLAGIRTEALPSLGRNINIFSDFKSFWQIYSYIKKEKPDILHLNSSKMLVLGAIAGRLAGCKNIIYTGHGWAFNESRSATSKYLLSLTYKFSLLFVDKIIFVSQTTKKQAEAQGINFPEKKTTVIYNGVTPIQYFDKEKARQIIIERITQSKNEIEENDFWLGTIAELHTSKGLEFAIEAMRKLPDNIRYFIIGNGEKRNDLVLLIKTYNLENRVHLVGPVDEASRLLRAFDLFILPSITEALPYAILEAGLAELPVIASSVGGIPEIITNEENGILLPPRDVKSLADKILNLVTDQEKRLRLGRNLAQTVSQNFSAEKMFVETNKIYQEML